jgi:hypothetical protein
MKRVLFGTTLAAVAMVVVVKAASSTTIVVTPTSPFVFDSNHITGVMLDGAPGFSTGSFRSDGVAKTDMYFAADNLFAREISLGEIASMSFWTKKGTTHVVDPVDWFVNIYTKPYAGDVSSPAWYGDRIGTEPYYSININETAGAWNQWSSDDSVNRLRFFESTAGAPGANFGSYTDPDWQTFVTGNSLSGQPYGGHKVLYFSIQTGSCCASGFTGQVDGLRLELTDGEVVNINLEPFIQPTDRDSCKKNAWMTLLRGNGTPFTNQGDCVSYVNTGK